jgi:cell division protein DivIC
MTVKQRKPKKLKKRRTGLGIIALVVLLLCGIVSYKRIGLEAESIQMQQKKQELLNQKESLIKEGQSIEDYKAYIQTKKYIEEVARKKLGLVYKDEIIFEPEDK